MLRALGHVTEARKVLAAATAWHRAAGGGERAGLGECLLAALAVDDPQADTQERLIAILDDARRNDEPHVEVFSLDALARIAANIGDLATAQQLCDDADQRMVDASDLITDLDRIDARAVPQLA